MLIDDTALPSCARAAGKDRPPPAPVLAADRGALCHAAGNLSDLGRIVGVDAKQLSVMHPLKAEVCVAVEAPPGGGLMPREALRPDLFVVAGQ